MRTMRFPPHAPSPSTHVRLFSGARGPGQLPCAAEPPPRLGGVARRCRALTFTPPAQKVHRCSQARKKLSTATARIRTLTFTPPVHISPSLPPHLPCTPHTAVPVLPGAQEALDSYRALQSPLLHSSPFTPPIRTSPARLPFTFLPGCTRGPPQLPRAAETPPCLGEVTRRIRALPFTPPVQTVHRCFQARKRISIATAHCRAPALQRTRARRIHPALLSSRGRSGASRTRSRACRASRRVERALSNQRPGRKKKE